MQMKTFKAMKAWKKSYKFFRNDLEMSRWSSFSTAFHSNNFWYGDQIIKFFQHSNVLPWNGIKTILYWRKCANRHYSDWFVDECDATMNKLMIHSLEFHMHLRPEKPVTMPFEGKRGEEALRVIAALKEEEPKMHPELSDYYLNKVHCEKEKESDNYVTMVFPKSERIDELRALDRQADLEYFERQQQARKDFIDLLPLLWS